jgi:hypothetical protein
MFLMMYFSEDTQLELDAPHDVKDAEAKTKISK